MTSIKILRLPNKYQRGAGWGNVFGRLTTFLRPLLSSVAKAGKPVVKNALKRIANESIKTGADIISDIAEGQNVRESIKQRGKEGLKSSKGILLDEVKKGINRQVGGKRKKPTGKASGQKKKKSNYKTTKKRGKKRSKFEPQKGHFF